MPLRAILWSALWAAALGLLEAVVVEAWFGIGPRRVAHGVETAATYGIYGGAPGLHRSSSPPRTAKEPGSSTCCTAR